MSVSRRGFLQGTAAGVVGLAAVGAAGVRMAGAAEAPASQGAPLGDGVYTAAAKGLGGDVTVTLTIQNGALADVVAEGPN